MLTRPLDLIVGTKTKVRLLRALAPLDLPVTWSEAKRLGRVASVRSSREALADLAALGVLVEHQSGRLRLYRINPEHWLTETLRRLFAEEEALMSGVREVLSNSLARPGMDTAVEAVILYGSSARGDAKPGSDVDLLVIASTEEAVRSVRDAFLGAEPVIRSRYGVRISPYVLSGARLEERRKEGDPFLDSVRTDGELLMGVPPEGLLEGW